MFNALRSERDSDKDLCVFDELANDALPFFDRGVPCRGGGLARAEDKGLSVLELNANLVIYIRCRSLALLNLLLRSTVMETDSCNLLIEVNLAFGLTRFIKVVIV